MRGKLTSVKLIFSILKTANIFFTDRIRNLILTRKIELCIYLIFINLVIEIQYQAFTVYTSKVKA